MTTVLLQALTFVVMIGLGIFSRTSGLLRAEDSRILMKLIVNITMPAALMSGFREFAVDRSLAFAIALGFLFNFVLLAAGWVCSLRRKPRVRALYLLNVPSYNIGNFVLPFVQGFFPSSAVLCLSMFDIGNNPYGTGITYSAACSVCGSDGRLSLGDIGRKLLHSPPFLSYMSMFVICLAGLRLPDPFFDLCGTIGQGNCFLAMFTLGLIFELHLPKEDAGEVFRILLLRYALCALCAAAVFFLTPFALVVRQTLVLCLLAPITTVSISYGLSCGCRQSMIAALSSLSMLFSFVLFLGLLVVWA